MAKRVVRALATPNNERLAQLLDKMLRAKWKIRTMTDEARAKTVFNKPGIKEAV